MLPLHSAVVQNALADENARWISVAAAARLSGLSEMQVRDRIAKGKIVGQRVLGRVCVLEASVREYLRQSAA